MMLTPNDLTVVKNRFGAYLLMGAPPDTLMVAPNSNILCSVRVGSAYISDVKPVCSLKFLSKCINNVTKCRSPLYSLITGQSPHPPTTIRVPAASKALFGTFASSSTYVLHAYPKKYQKIYPASLSLGQLTPQRKWPYWRNNVKL